MKEKVTCYGNLLLILIVVILFHRKSYAQTSALDPTFGNNGKVITTLSGDGSIDRAEASLLQPDGKMVVAGSAELNGNVNVAVFRFNEDGTFDPTFGTKGSAIIDHNYYPDYAYSLAIQPDGKYLLAGESQDGLLMIRLLPDGHADSSFSQDGLYVNDYAGGFYHESLLGVAVLPDGKIIAAGQFYDGSNYPLLLLRLLPDGTPDPSFGTNGFIEELTDLYTENIHLALDTNNRLLICAKRGGFLSGFGVNRYSSDGIPDSSFGVNGKATVPLDPTNNETGAITVHPNGKIVVVGSSEEAFTFRERIALCRFLDDGTPDNLFGSGGKVITELPNFNGLASSVVVLPGGKTMVGVSWEDVFYQDNGFMLIAYNANGTIDSSFGTNGFVQTNTNESAFFESATGLHVTPQGEIFFSSTATYGVTGLDFFAARFLPNGKADTSYGANGIARGNLMPAPSSELANDIALRDDGTMVVAGRVDGNYFDADVLVGKYSAQGVPYSTFGDEGFVRIVVDNEFDEATSLAEGPDGSFVVGGNMIVGSYFGQFLLKLKPNGEQDFNFGDQGICRNSFNNQYSVLHKVAIQPDNKILSCGALVSFSSDHVCYIARYLAYGSPDSTFGDDGVFIYDASLNTHESFNDLVLLSDGSIVACGDYGVYPYQDTNFVLKLLPNGTLDNNFGTAGIAIVVDSFINSSTSLFVTADGGITVAGEGHVPGFGWSQVAFYRLFPGGQLDSAFGINGKRVIENLDVINNYPDLEQLSDGRYAVTSFSQSVITNNPDVALLMLNSNGTPDSTYYADGWSTVDVQTEADAGNCIAVQPDDKILIAGSSSSSPDGDLVILRFLPTTATTVHEPAIIPVNSGLLIYPNPAHDVVEIRNPFYTEGTFINTASEKVLVMIRNSLGEKVASFSFENHQISFHIGISQLSHGMYFLETTYGTDKKMGKLICE